MLTRGGAREGKRKYNLAQDRHIVPDVATSTLDGVNRLTVLTDWAYMARDVLRVDNVSAETKQALREAALKEYGVANASLMVRMLINKFVGKNSSSLSEINHHDASERVRVVLQIPVSVLNEIDKKANNRLSDRNYYLTNLILKDCGVGQLQGDEIEVLRRSNYEMSKIGTNLNQIAKAFNILVKGVGGDVPEIGKKMSSLRKEISEHTRKVLRVLNAGSVVVDSKNSRQGKLKKKG